MKNIKIMCMRTQNKVYKYYSTFCVYPVYWVIKIKLDTTLKHNWIKKINYPLINWSLISIKAQIQYEVEVCWRMQTSVCPEIFTNNKIILRYKQKINKSQTESRILGFRSSDFTSSSKCVSNFILFSGRFPHNLDLPLRCCLSHQSREKWLCYQLHTW